MSNIENLLRRHYEGVITQEEQSELDCLTHRDQVISAANKRARVLHHRRMAGATGVASVLLVAGAIFFLHPSYDPAKAEFPTVARTDVPKMPVSIPTQPSIVIETPQNQSRPADVRMALDETAVPTVHKEQPAAIEPVATQSDGPQVDDIVPPTVITDSETIVACNTACSPDSVINDIWKFLRT